MPDPFGPVTSRNPPRSSRRSTLSRTRLSPKRYDTLLAEITAQNGTGGGAGRGAAAAAQTASAKTKTKKARLITPFIVKNAASRRRRSSGRTSECS